MADPVMCPDCDQPMLPLGEIKRRNEYDHARGCPRAAMQWLVIREHEDARQEYLRDHTGGSGNDVLSWTDSLAGAWIMCLRDAQRYAAVSYVPAYPEQIGVAIDRRTT